MSANLISTVAQIITPDLVTRIASAVGLDKSLIDRALSAGVPALLAALGSLVSKPGGAAAVNAEVARQEPQLAQNLGPLLGGSGVASRIDAGSNTLRSLLGGQTMSSLASAVGRYAGIGEAGATGLMGLLGPVVMSVLSDQQRSSGRSPADIIAAQKDNIARALPAGVSKSLQGSGMLDWITADATQAARGDGQQGFEFQPAKGRAARREGAASSWVIPALAVAAIGLAWYLLSGPRTTDVAKAPPPVSKTEAPLTTGALPEPKEAAFPSLQSLAGMKVGDVDLGAQVTSAVNGMRDALQGVRDEATAQSAVDPLRRSVAEFGRVSGLASQLSPEMRKTLAAAIAAARPTIDGLCDKALQVPGAAALIKPTIDSIRSELDTLATA